MEIEIVYSERQISLLHSRLAIREAQVTGNESFFLTLTDMKSRKRNNQFTILILLKNNTQSLSKNIL
jgi:hypothetical protein